MGDSQAKCMHNGNLHATFGANLTKLTITAHHCVQNNNQLPKLLRISEPRR